jgi:LytS/YehU family sensor histidine kinase
VFDDFITDKPLQGYIVPCTLQLLVENAIKHNVISVQKPLVLTATTDGMSITISNNRIPKLTPVRSTGIGLQYIRNQYRDIAGLEIQIVETDDTFSVTIPLIRESEDFFVPLNRKHKQV